MTPNRILTRALDDVWLDALRARCARAIADYLQQSVNLQRPIASLSRAEMHGMAEAATAEWIKAVSERLQEVQILGDSQLTPKTDKYVSLIMGG